MKDAALEKESVTLSELVRCFSSIMACVLLALWASMPSKTTMEEPAIMDVTKKNMGRKGEYHSGCSLPGQIRKREPREDWCRVERQTPMMVSRMPHFSTQWRHLSRTGHFLPSHSQGQMDHSTNRTVR